MLLGWYITVEIRQETGNVKFIVNRSSSGGWWCVDARIGVGILHWRVAAVSGIVCCRQAGCLWRRGRLAGG